MGMLFWEKIPRKTTRERVISKKVFEKQRAKGWFEKKSTKNNEKHSGLSAPLHPRTACNKKQAAGKRVPQQPAFT